MTFWRYSVKVLTRLKGAMTASRLLLIKYLLAFRSNVDALAEHNMEALRAELALDSAFAQHAAETEVEPDADGPSEHTNAGMAHAQPDSNFVECLRPAGVQEEPDHR